MINSKTVTLEEICEKGSSNIALNEIENNFGTYPIYGAAGFLKNVDFYKSDKPYIGIVKDGAGVGRVSIHPEKSSLIGIISLPPSVEFPSHASLYKPSPCSVSR